MSLLRKLLAIILGVFGVLAAVEIWKTYPIWSILLGLLTLSTVIELIKKWPRGFTYLAIVLVVYASYFVLK